ncbi:MAG: hypothetical protein N0C91_20905, partial [Candidatus Thiodiazotropha endolucinida]|nr:hypothetical protein [Candidatus Thiodiazotropha taylori]MCG8121397.1 hypothetical protein [Candidatus Thiodiazotropha taylori]MCW4290159.1 hypothetical protein [Candidatus Thiodiazotropha endolucinida]MCW4297090.1 hypothetical protein [Candidatus Thiodiazotropha endolucinida]
SRFDKLDVVFLFFINFALITDTLISVNRPYSIAMEPSGVLWIGTNNGLSRFDGNEWTTFGRNDGFSDLNVYAVVVTPNGEIWAGTKGAVVRLGINKGDG